MEERFGARNGCSNTKESCSNAGFHPHPFRKETALINNNSILEFLYRSYATRRIESATRETDPIYDALNVFPGSIFVILNAEI